MCKKLGITALVVMIAIAVASWVGVLPYAKIKLDKARQGIKDSVPPELKLERLKDELSRLPEETKRARSQVAAETVEVRKLEAQIAEAEKNLEARAEQIRSLRASLKSSGDNHFVSIRGEKLARKDVEDSLARKWESFKQVEASIASQKELLKARQDALNIAKQTLEAMNDKKVELENEVAKLEFELKKLRLAQTKHDVPIDQSKLSEVKQLLDEVKTQIAKEQTELEMEKAVFTDNIKAVDEKVDRKIKAENALKEIDERFGDDKVVTDKK